MDDGTDNGEHGYRHVDVAELPDAPDPGRHEKEIDEAVGATAFGLDRYTLDPGEQALRGYRRHDVVQEENGTAHRLFCTGCGAEAGLLTPGPASEP